MLTNYSGHVMTTAEVARLLHVRINTVRRWSARGILRPYRIGPHAEYRFNREDVLDFLSAQYHDKSYTN